MHKNVYIYLKGIATIAATAIVIYKIALLAFAAEQCGL